MQSYVKAVALASVAITLHGCGEKEEKEFLKQGSSETMQTLLTKNVENVEQIAKNQVKEVLKNAKFQAAGSELIAAAFHAVPDNHQVHEIVKSAQAQLSVADGAANAAVTDAFKFLHEQLSALDLSNANKEAKKVFDSALKTGESTIMKELEKAHVSKNSIETAAESVEKMVKEKFGVDVDSSAGIKSVFETVNHIVSQVKDSKKVINSIDLMSVANHLGGTKFEGINIDDAEKELRKVFKKAIQTTTSGLQKVEENAAKIQKNKAKVLKETKRVIGEAEQKVHKMVN